MESVGHKCHEIREDAQYQHLLNFHDALDRFEQYIWTLQVAQIAPIS